MFNLKTVLSLSLASALMVAGANSAFAMSEDHAHKKAEKLKTELNLTDDQVKKIEGIYTESRKQRESLHESTKTQVRNVLTADQQKKFDEMQAKKASKKK
jgi:Spy/CpxP family protein refolding chaperone